jgi:2-oxoglutarate dehydrogenase E2 component (dihydrolipoamide succinyltransferase)
MNIPLTLSSLGEAVERATVLQWFKESGEAVEVGEPIVEVSTDKVDVEIPSPATGILLEILVAENAMAAAGDVLGVIRAGGMDNVQPAPERVVPAAPSEEASEPSVEHTEGTQLAADAVANAVQVVPAPSPGAGDSSAGGLRGTTGNLSRLRKTIARRMTESLRTSAQLTTIVEVDVTEVGKLRLRHNADVAAGEVRLSYLAFVAVAAVRALVTHPQLNCSVDLEAGTITYAGAEHLGVAVDTDRGLLVPVIRDAGRLSIGELAARIVDVADRTRRGQITVDELSGGTFTITNTGSRGALMDTPILNPPQVAILATGAVTRRSVVLGVEGEDESTAIRSMMYLSLTYDHRAVDGADAARYLTTVKSTLEHADFDVA